MKTSAIFGVSLLAGLVAAVPLEKRDLVVVTVTEEVIEVVDVTTTVTVNACATSCSHSYSWSWSQASTTSSSTTTSTSSSAVSSSSSVLPTQTSSAQPEQYYVESSHVSSQAAPTSTSSTSVYTPSSSTTPAVSESSSAPAEAHVAQAETQSSEKYDDAAQKHVESKPPSEAPKSDGGEKFTGELTYYQAGQGSCGWTSDSWGEDVVALPVGLMHSVWTGNPNLHPWCGKDIVVTHNGKTITVKVVDTCMGCKGNSLDVSEKAFGQLEKYEVGRTDCEWKWA